MYAGDYTWKMAEHDGIFLPAISESKISSPKLTHRPNSFTGHVFLSPQIYAQRSQSIKPHIDLDNDIQRLSIGSSSTLHSSPASCRRTTSDKEPGEGNTPTGKPRSRSGSPLSYKSQSPASTPGLRRRKLEHKISPLAGDDFYSSVSDIRPRAKSFTCNNRRDSSTSFKTNLITAASRDSLDVGLSRLDVTDNILYSDKSPAINELDVPTETLEKCQKWLEGVTEAGNLERPLNAVMFTNVDWSDE